MLDQQAADWRHDAVAALVILALIPLLVVGIDSVGPTIDEPFHLVRGLAWWWTDSTRLSYAHPPVANVLQALPAALLYEPLPLTELEGWPSANHAHMAEELFATRYASVRPMLWAGRFVTMGIMLVLAIGTYAWTSRRLGAWTGLVALVLVAFNPTMLAHAQLLTTDLPVAASLFFAGASFVDYLSPRRPEKWRSWLNLAVFALAMAIALGTKFTALSMVPLLGTVGIVWAIRGWGRFSSQGASVGGRLLRVLGEAGVVAIVSLVFIAAIYRFEEIGLTIGQILEHPEPRCHLTEDFDGGFLEQRLLSSSLPRWLPLPVPYSWWFGMEMVRYHGAYGHSTWFAGFRYGMGNPAYFPVMLLIKNPAVWVVGVGAACVMAIKRRSLPVGLAIPGLMGLGMLALLAVSNLNIGVRHALPIIMLWSLLAAAGWVAMARAILEQPAWIRIAASAAALGSLLLPPLTASGHYLGYFSIGRLGYAISVVGEDWGQDTIHLARTAQALDMDPVRYVTYGIGGLAELKHQGVDPLVARCGTRYPEWGWLIMHRAVVVRWPACTKGVDHRPPDLIIADHLYAWDLSGPH